MYPQVKASARVVAQQELFRIKKGLDPSAAIYEIDSSAKAIAIGPDSDFSRAIVTYFDGSLDEGVQEAIISVGSPFVGRLDSVVSQRNRVSNTRGRLLVWTDQRYRNGHWFPTTAKTNDVIIRPVLDIVSHFRDPPSLPTARSDRVYRVPFPLSAEYQGDGTKGLNRIMIPFYGRRYASILFSPSGLGDLSGDPTVTIHGRTIAMGNFDITDVEIVNSTIAKVGRTHFEAKASDDGLFDYLLVTVKTAAEADVFNGETSSEELFVSVRTSDEEV